MSMVIDARQSDFVCKGEVIVVQISQLHFICIGRRAPSSAECLEAIAKHIEKEKK